MIANLDADKTIEAVEQLLKFLFQQLGVAGTLTCAVLFVVASIAWRIYNDKKKEKEINLALQEKDRTIIRLASQERAWRIQYFKESKGWTDEQIDKYILQNELPNIPAMRKELEGRKAASLPVKKEEE